MLHTKAPFFQLLRLNCLHICTYELIPPLQRSYRYPGCFETLHYGTERFCNWFLTFTVNERSKIDSGIKGSDTYATLKKSFWLL